jgi:hypothetical protein
MTERSRNGPSAAYLMLHCARCGTITNYSWSRTDRGYACRLLDFKLQADDALHRQISNRTEHSSRHVGAHGEPDA